METFWQAHFYRQAYGDAGYGSIPFLAREIPDATGPLSQALLARYANPKLRKKGAQTADLVDEQGRVVLRLNVRDIVNCEAVDPYPAPKPESVGCE
jgi:hypothetical protein